MGLNHQSLVNESLSVGPTRYRTVVLTSWDRGRSDCEQDPPATPLVGFRIHIVSLHGVNESLRITIRGNYLQVF